MGLKGTLLEIDKSFLAQITPFQNLPKPELDRLTSCAQERQHDKGEHIFSEGEEASSVWVLKTGRLDIYKYSTEGKPHAIETISPGELFGTLCRVGGSSRVYPCTAVAAENSSSFRIADSVFLDLFHRFPSVVTGVCTLCSQRLNQMQDLNCTTQEPVEKRIAKTLIDLSKKHGAVIPLTKREISEFAATTVETTIRTMSKFEKRNLISSVRGRVTLLDIPKLKMIYEQDSPTR